MIAHWNHINSRLDMDPNETIELFVILNTQLQDLLCRYLDHSSKVR